MKYEFYSPVYIYKHGNLLYEAGCSGNAENEKGDAP